eukprot:1181724-Prorocentrum_minimum.AAC.1
MIRSWYTRGAPSCPAIGRRSGYIPPRAARFLMIRSWYTRGAPPCPAIGRRSGYIPPRAARLALHNTPLGAYDSHHMDPGAKKHLRLTPHGSWSQKTFKTHTTWILEPKNI